MATPVKKKQNRKPSRRQELATKIITENHAIPLKQAMIAAGYSVNTAKKPENLTESDYFQKIQAELREAYQDAGFVPAAFAQNITRIAFTSSKRDQFSGEITSDDAKQLDGLMYGAETLGWNKSAGDTNILINVQPILSIEAE